LDDETQEEEEIELEQGDVNLVIMSVDLAKRLTKFVDGASIPGNEGIASSCDNQHQCS
jgi:hypothetical protein